MTRTDVLAVWKYMYLYNYTRTQMLLGKNKHEPLWRIHLRTKRNLQLDLPRVLEDRLSGQIEACFVDDVSTSEEL